MIFNLKFLAPNVDSSSVYIQERKKKNINVHTKTFIWTFTLAHSNSQTVEINQRSISWWMDSKMRHVSMQWNIIQTHTKNLGTDTCCDIDKLEIIKLSSRIHHKRPYIIWFYLYEMSKIGKSIKNEHKTAGCLRLRMMIANRIIKKFLQGLLWWSSG